MVTIVPGLCALAVVPAIVLAQRRGEPTLSGGTNPDGSLRPTPRSRGCSRRTPTPDAILAPGSEAFRIRFLPEETRVGATELVNDARRQRGLRHRGHDPRTGKPLTFTYQDEGAIPTRSTRRCQSRCRRAASAAC